MARPTKAISELTAADVGKDVGKDVGYTAQFLVKKAGFTPVARSKEVRHLSNQTVLVIGYASIIVPAEYRRSESIIFGPAVGSAERTPGLVAVVTSRRLQPPGS